MQCDDSKTGIRREVWFLKTECIGKRKSLLNTPWGFLKLERYSEEEKPSKIDDYGVSVFGGENPVSNTPLKLQAWRCIGLGWLWSKIKIIAKLGCKSLLHLSATAWFHFNCNALKRPDIPRACFNVLMHRKKDRTSLTELNVFTDAVLPLLELLSHATTVHLEPLDLAHALSALLMAYDLSSGTSIKEIPPSYYTPCSKMQQSLLKRSQGTARPKDQSPVGKIYSAEHIETTKSDPVSKLDE